MQCTLYAVVLNRCWCMLKSVLQVPCQNVQRTDSNTIVFNMLSISLWIPVCLCSVMSLAFPRLSWHCWCLAALMSSNTVSLLSVCLFNMQRRSFGESFWTSVNESATMISWRCRGCVHHRVSAFGDRSSSLRSSCHGPLSLMQKAVSAKNTQTETRVNTV